MDEAQQNMVEIKAKYAAGLRDTDHPDWCHAGSSDMVIGMHGGIYEVLFNGCGKYDRMFRILAPHENSNDWTHGSWKFRSDFRRLTIGSTVSTIREIPFTDGRFVKTNKLATVSARSSWDSLISKSPFSRIISMPFGLRTTCDYLVHSPLGASRL